MKVRRSHSRLARPGGGSHWAASCPCPRLDASECDGVGVLFVLLVLAAGAPVAIRRLLFAVSRLYLVLAFLFLRPLGVSPSSVPVCVELLAVDAESSDGEELLRG